MALETKGFLRSRAFFLSLLCQLSWSLEITATVQAVTADAEMIRMPQVVHLVVHIGSSSKLLPFLGCHSLLRTLGPMESPLCPGLAKVEMQRVSDNPVVHSRSAIQLCTHLSSSISHDLFLTRASSSQNRKQWLTSLR